MLTNPETVLAIDIVENGVAFREVTVEISDAVSRSLALRIPSPRNKSLDKGHRLYETVSAGIEAYYRTHGLVDLSQTAVVLGTSSDPFYPFEGRFHKTLQLLELLLKEQPVLLSIQTRSPLAVLALPILKPLGSSLILTMAIETLDEKFASEICRGLPRPLERLNAMSVFKNFGLTTFCQASILVEEHELESIARESSLFYLADPEQVASPNIRRRLQQSVASRYPRQLVRGPIEGMLRMLPASAQEIQAA